MLYGSVMGSADTLTVMRHLPSWPMLRAAATLLVLLTVCGLVSMAGAAAYRLVRAQVAADIYLARLVELRDRYDDLRRHYNEAVRQTAVTELIVKDDRVSVVIRNATGDLRTIETPFKPDRELYIDYIVLDGRLWIRRVFDDRTPPNDAVTIDPQLADIDWNAANVAHGKAVYRRLSEGRWVVTVTGDGSLGLARQTGTERPELVAAPALKDFNTIEQDAAAAADDVSLLDVVRHFILGG